MNLHNFRFPFIPEMYWWHCSRWRAFIVKFQTSNTHATNSVFVNHTAHTAASWSLNINIELDTLSLHTRRSMLCRPLHRRFSRAISFQITWVDSNGSGNDSRAPRKKCLANYNLNGVALHCKADLSSVQCRGPPHSVINRNVPRQCMYAEEMSIRCVWK